MHRELLIEHTSLAHCNRIWIFHAQIPVHGENPFLRTIFYKITTLLQQPVLPVFVFGEFLRKLPD